MIVKYSFKTCTDVPTFLNLRETMTRDMPEKKGKNKLEKNTQLQNLAEVRFSKNDF